MKVYGGAAFLFTLYVFCIVIDGVQAAQGSNHSPVAMDDNVTVAKDEATKIDVLSNDSDPDNDTIWVDNVTQPAHGQVTLTVSAGGGCRTVTYTPVTGYVGYDNFTYTLKDSNGGTDKGTVFIIVTGQFTLTTRVAMGKGKIDPLYGFYAPHTVVCLTASPSAGYWLRNWSGTDDDGCGDKVNYVTMDSNKTVAVEFGTEVYTLEAAVVGEHGSVSPEEGTYDYGTVVTLTATPDPGYHVKKWTGVTGGATSSSINYVMITTDVRITVEFAADVPLKFYLGTCISGGKGTISPSEGWFAADSTVALTARPEPGYHVAKWVGTDDDGATGTVNQVTMSLPKYVSVTFQADTTNAWAGGCQLTAEVVGGHGSVNPVTEWYAARSLAAITAIPDFGYQVKAWTGTDNDNITDNTTVVTMTSDRTVKVAFEPIPPPRYRLSILVIGGRATVLPASGSRYAPGAKVCLVVQPDPGYTLKTWFGTDNDASTDLANIVTMTTDKSVTLAIAGQAATPTPNIIPDAPSNVPNDAACLLSSCPGGSVVILAAVLAFSLLRSRKEHPDS
jgi:hypothetical protein